MKIALFHNLPSGGALRSVDGWVDWLRQRHAVDLYTLDSHTRPEFWEIQREGGTTTTLPAPAPRYWKRPFGLFNPLAHRQFLRRLERVYAQLASRIDGGGYQLAFVHACQLVQAPALLRFLRLPSVYYCQEPSRRLYDASADVASRRHPGRDRAIQQVEARYDRLAFEAADQVLANSQYTRETVKRIYGRDAPVIPPGVDTDHFRPTDTPDENARPLMLSVGAISVLKGFEFLIESLARIDAQRRPELLVVGDRGASEEAQRLMRLASERGVALTIRPPISDPALVRLYNEATLFLYAPVMEPLGLAPLEAMACGTPVVGVREGGVAETVVPGVSGVLTERDPDRFAAAVLDLLEDAPRRAALGQTARAHVIERWSMPVLGAQLEAFLIEVGSSA